jgi:B12 binding domain/Radical SAM superfamily
MLINPPNGLHDRTDLAPPLGLLTLAAVARQHGHEVCIEDLNLEVMANPEIDGDEFYEITIESIVRSEPQVIGFTSMCMESHISLELGRQAKAKLPDVKTIFGGTHFGAIAREILTYFPFVDFVVAGEGERAIVAILDYLSNSEGCLPKNVLYREADRMRFGSEEPCRPLLEDLPFPAYDLVNLQRYFALNPRCVLDYDGGRGCIFKCAFCYSPFQYGDAIRNKPPTHIVSDLRRLSELGAKHVFFVQDNLLNSPKWVTELCERIADAELPLTWSGYVTYPQLTQELVDLMSRSRCTGIFTGIDAVSRDYQQRMNKRFLRNWQTVRKKLMYCVQRGVIPTCAFILEGPDQPPVEREETIRAAVECLGLGCEVHVNTLSIYNGSMLDSKNAKGSPTYSSAKVELLMDSPNVVQNNEFAKRWPSLFPYHSTYYDAQQWEIFLVRVHTLFALLYAFPQTLHRYIVEEKNSVWDGMEYIDHWFLAWLRQQPLPVRRSAAIEKFCEHFASQSLSKKSIAIFQRELARFTLSQCEGYRRVNLIVDGITQAYILNWFIELSQSKKNPGRAKEMVIYSGQKTVDAPKYVDHQNHQQREFALLSERNTVKIMTLFPDVAWVLSCCEEAADSEQALSLDREQLEQLEREGWIWR